MYKKILLCTFMAGFMGFYCPARAAEIQMGDQKFQGKVTVHQDGTVTTESTAKEEEVEGLGKKRLKLKYKEGKLAIVDEQGEEMALEQGGKFKKRGLIKERSAESEKAGTSTVTTTTKALSTTQASGQQNVITTETGKPEQTAITAGEQEQLKKVEPKPKPKVTTTTKVKETVAKKVTATKAATEDAVTKDITTKKTVVQETVTKEATTKKTTAKEAATTQTSSQKTTAEAKEEAKTQDKITQKKPAPKIDIKKAGLEGEEKNMVPSGTALVVLVEVSASEDLMGPFAVTMELKLKDTKKTFTEKIEKLAEGLNSFQWGLDKKPAEGNYVLSIEIVQRELAIKDKTTKFFKVGEKKAVEKAVH